MRLVAINTGHLVLTYRMMGELGEFHPYVGVTGVAQLIHLLTADLLLRPLVQLVTIEATYIAVGVDA